MPRTLSALALVLLPAPLPAADPTPTEKTFRTYADRAVGGTWTAADAAGKKYEYRYEWALDKQFLRLAGKEGDLTFEELSGIDPASGKWTLWGFDNKGTVWQGNVVEIKPGEVSVKIVGKAKTGKLVWTAKETMVGPDTVKREILEFIDDDKPQPTETMTWTRKK